MRTLNPMGEWNGGGIPSCRETDAPFALPSAGKELDAAIGLLLALPAFSQLHVTRND